MPYQQRWLDRGGERIGLHWYAEPEPGQAPLVLIYPAMGVPAGFYRPFASALTRHGLAVVVADLRGTGASSPRPSRSSRYGYAELADDLAEVLTQLAPYRAGRRLTLLGHSLGGQLSLLHLARSGGTDVDQLALVGVGLPYWRLYPGWRRWAVPGFTRLIAAGAAALGVWPGWGFGGRQAQGVIRDWAYGAHTGRLPPLSGVDLEPALASLTLPVLALSIEKDQFVPRPTMDHVIDKLPAAPMTREHVNGEADHFSWARDPDHPIATTIARFAGSSH